MADEAAPVDAAMPTRPAAGREPWPWSDAEKTAMLAGVEGMIYQAALGFRRKRKKALSDDSDFEDCAQFVRLRLWEEVGHFRPDGPAEWSTWAHHAIGFAVKRFQGDRHKAVLFGKARQPDAAEADAFGACDPEYDDDADALAEVGPAELDATEAYLTGVRRIVHADKLACLTESQRSIVEAVAFERLTLPQVAGRLGHKLSIVEIGFRASVAKLFDAGHFTADEAAAFGVTVRRTKPQKRFQGDEAARYEAALASDRPAADIAAEFGVKSVRVNDNRRRRGLPVRRPKPRPAPVARPPRDPRPKWVPPPREPKPRPVPKPPREPRARRDAAALAARLAAEGRLAAWHEALASGRRRADVAAEFGVSDWAVCRGRRGLPAGARPSRRPGRQLADRLAAEGRTQLFRDALASDRPNADVAREFGLSPCAVYCRRRAAAGRNSPPDSPE